MRHTGLPAWAPLALIAAIIGLAAIPSLRLHAVRGVPVAWLLAAAAAGAMLARLAGRWEIASPRSRPVGPPRPASDRADPGFLKTIAHELRNSLAPIRYAGESLAPSADACTIEDARKIVARQVRLMSRLVEDLLDDGCMERGEFSLFRQAEDLRAIAADAVAMARPLMEERRHRFTSSTPDRPIPVDVDAARITHVVANLLNNAAKYTEPGGQIVLTLLCEGEHVWISVSDTGIGLVPHMRERVFDRFVQSDRALPHARGGLGIGLALVRSVVEQHGGLVEACSEGAGKGSEFRVRLPLARTVEVQTDGPALAPSTPRRILLVEDQPDSARALQRLLTLWGHDVRHVDDGGDALIAASSARFDVVLLDIGLPGLSGYEVAYRLRGMDSPCRPLILAHSGAEADEGTGSSPFDAFLQKPIDLAELRDRLDRLEPIPSTAPSPERPSRESD